MRMSLKKINSQQGFTLLEVMVALALIGISLATLLTSQSQGLRLANEAKFNTIAAFLAQRKMAELETVDINDLRSDSGDFSESPSGLTDESFSEFYWEVEIDGTSIPILEEYADHFKQIDLNIYFGEDRIYEYSIRLYKFVPK